MGTNSLSLLIINNGTRVLSREFIYSIICGGEIGYPFGGEWENVFNITNYWRNSKQRWSITTCVLGLLLPKVQG